MFEVLMYLFENYMDGSSSIALGASQDTVITELEQAGFTRFEIIRALDWLDGLIKIQECVESGPKLNDKSIRCFAKEESERLNVEAKGFLFYLEKLGILDPMTREVVLDRILALDIREVDLGRIKWVILIALLNQPNKKSALSLLQDMILSDAFGVLH